MADTVITRDAFDLACQILGIDPAQVTLSDAKKARDTLVRGLHPDSGATDSQENRRKIGDIQEAFNMIRDCGGTRPEAPPPIRGPFPSGFRSGGHPFFHHGGGSATDPFDDVFRVLYGTPPRGQGGHAPQVADVTIQVSLLEVLQGCQRTVQVPIYGPCPRQGGGRHSLNCECHGSNMVSQGFQSYNMNILPGCGVGAGGPTETRLRFGGKGRPQPSGERGDFIISVVWDHKPIPVKIGDQEIGIIFHPRGPWLAVQGSVALDPIQALLGGVWSVQLPWLPPEAEPVQIPIPDLYSLAGSEEGATVDLLEGQERIVVPRPKGGILHACVDLPVEVRLRRDRALTQREKILLGLLAQERGLPLPKGYPDLPPVDQVVTSGLPKGSKRRKKGPGKPKSQKEPTASSDESA